MTQLNIDQIAKQRYHEKKNWKEKFQEACLQSFSKRYSGDLKLESYQQSLSLKKEDEVVSSSIYIHPNLPVLIWKSTTRTTTISKTDTAHLWYEVPDSSESVLYNIHQMVRETGGNDNTSDLIVACTLETFTQATDPNKWVPQPWQMGVRGNEITSWICNNTKRHIQNLSAQGNSELLKNIHNLLYNKSPLIFMIDKPEKLEEACDQIVDILVEKMLTLMLSEQQRVEQEQAE